MQTREELLQEGIFLMRDFCLFNRLSTPKVNVRSKDEWKFAACAYYRPEYIEICVTKCAFIGRAGRAWSYPGHIIDRTPYGVIQHELGHHADMARSSQRRAYTGDYSDRVFKLAGEKPITGYCPNNGEWFAEMFRLFVTNPDLLARIRPNTFGILSNDWNKAHPRPWQAVLRQAPQRTKDLVAKRVAETKRR